MTYEHVMQLALIAAHLSGRAMPDHPPPHVREVTTEQMHRLACDKDAPVDDGCWNTIGRYADGGDLIWVDASWIASDAGIMTEDSIVVHELVHWLQYEHAWGGGTCRHLQAREAEAYRVQTKYIVQYEHKAVELKPPDPPEHCE